MKPNREYRTMELRLNTDPEKEEDYKVEGYASTFDTYLLFSSDGVDYYERIEPTAFENADLSDVVFRVDHEGSVYARTSAGTVDLWVDEHGLGNRTDLSRTAKSRELFSEIKAGNYPQMSFAFSVDDDGDDYDKETHTRIIHRIKKVFDVSAVSFPANPYTELSVATRDYFNGVIEAEKAERLEREARLRQIQKIRILTEV